MIEPLMMSANSGNGITLVSGQVAFTVPGTHTFIVPEGVYEVSAVCVGGTVTYGGAGLSWRTFDVIPGEELEIFVGGKTLAVGVDTRITRSLNDNVLLHALGSTTGLGGIGGSALNPLYGGGSGGGSGSATANGYTSYGCGAAGGYRGNGGSGRAASVTPPSTSAGVGGSGSGGTTRAPSSGSIRGSVALGGGVGIFGEGASGAGLTNVSYSAHGKNGSVNLVSGQIAYGAGGAGTSVSDGRVGTGACRIIWGPDREYPSTNTLDV